MHVGSIGGNVKGILTRWKLEDIHEGDIFIHNHPFHGTSHSPDFNTYIGSTAINYFTLALFGIDNWFLWFIIFLNRSIWLIIIKIMRIMWWIKKWWSKIIHFLFHHHLRDSLLQ